MKILVFVSYFFFSFIGAVLMSPENVKHLSVLKAIVRQVFPCGAYTGVHATFSKGDYFSVEGVPLARMPLEWAPDEPENFENSEECLIIQPNGTVADVKCSDVYPYLCYRKRTKPFYLTECGTVDQEYTLDPRTGSCYKFHAVRRTWHRAFMTCAAEGAHLAIINSDTEARVLQELFAKHPDPVHNTASIGMHNWGEKQVWSTIHGELIQEAGYAKFDIGQPDNYLAGPYCGGVFRDMGLDDLSYSMVIPFICEKAPDTLLTTEDYS